MEPGHQPRVAIIGGGLAGLAAAIALSGRGLQIELIEARQTLGGRATSYRDAVSGEWIDNCQHVSMRCCTNLADFCARAGIAGAFRRDSILHFFSPEGKRYDFEASRWLPAPLHLGPALMGFKFLSLAERIGIARAMWRLLRMTPSELAREETIGEWLRRHGQSELVLARFWSVVLVSALSETLDRASVSAARKVFVDGFMSNRHAYEVEVPTMGLGELYGERLETALRQQGVNIRLSTHVHQIEGSAAQVTGLRTNDKGCEEYDAIVLAVPWRKAAGLCSDAIRRALPCLEAIDRIESAPIAGVHLWFDRALTELPHAVFVGRLSQWFFNRGEIAATDNCTARRHYVQVVISASRELAGRDRQGIVNEIRNDLNSAFPSARNAQLLHWRIVVEQNAVFSVVPGLDDLRPPQQTAIPNLMLAGDWTRTDWPSTMEGAVRSGYLAAEAVLRKFGRSDRLLVPDLPRSWLMNRLMPSDRG